MGLFEIRAWQIQIIDFLTLFTIKVVMKILSQIATQPLAGNDEGLDQVMFAQNFDRIVYSSFGKRGIIQHQSMINFIDRGVDAMLVKKLQNFYPLVSGFEIFLFE